MNRFLNQITGQRRVQIEREEAEVRRQRTASNLYNELNEEFKQYEDVRTTQDTQTSRQEEIQLKKRLNQLKNKVLEKQKLLDELRAVTSEKEKELHPTEEIFLTTQPIDLSYNFSKSTGFGHGRSKISEYNLAMSTSPRFNFTSTSTGFNSTQTPTPDSLQLSLQKTEENIFAELDEQETVKYILKRTKMAAVKQQKQANELSQVFEKISREYKKCCQLEQVAENAKKNAEYVLKSVQKEMAQRRSERADFLREKEQELEKQRADQMVISQRISDKRRNAEDLLYEKERMKQLHDEEIFQEQQAKLRAPKINEENILNVILCFKEMQVRFLDPEISDFDLISKGDRSRYREFRVADLCSFDEIEENDLIDDPTALVEKIVSRFEDFVFQEQSLRNRYQDLSRQERTLQNELENLHEVLGNLKTENDPIIAYFEDKPVSDDDVEFLTSTINLLKEEIEANKEKTAKATEVENFEHFLFVTHSHMDSLVGRMIELMMFIGKNCPSILNPTEDDAFNVAVKTRVEVKKFMVKKAHASTSQNKRPILSEGSPQGSPKHRDRKRDHFGWAVQEPKSVHEEGSVYEENPAENKDFSTFPGDFLHRMFVFVFHDAHGFAHEWVSKVRANVKIAEYLREEEVKELLSTLQDPQEAMTQRFMGQIFDRALATQEDLLNKLTYVFKVLFRKLFDCNREVETDLAETIGFHFNISTAPLPLDFKYDEKQRKSVENRIKSLDVKDEARQNKIRVVEKVHKRDRYELDNTIDKSKISQRDIASRGHNYSHSHGHSVNKRSATEVDESEEQLFRSQDRKRLLEVNKTYTKTISSNSRKDAKDKKVSRNEILYAYRTIGNEKREIWDIQRNINDVKKKEKDAGFIPPVRLSSDKMPKKLNFTNPRHKNYSRLMLAQSPQDEIIRNMDNKVFLMAPNPIHSTLMNRREKKRKSTSVSETSSQKSRISKSKSERRLGGPRGVNSHSRHRVEDDDVDPSKQLVTLEVMPSHEKVIKRQKKTKPMELSESAHRFNDHGSTHSRSVKTVSNAQAAMQMIKQRLDDERRKLMSFPTLKSVADIRCLLHRFLPRNISAGTEPEAAVMNAIERTRILGLKE
eukprot:CAMPEP_0115006040 /NCGR_PEP_ID=MMETSP0216-20121206/20244_1 /TAXON_ID=223996 /ORGANISM="Protocruzia adherens, Strain Boccale" /LENGTH=1097 /DNA_ID=CAMNT_0002372509 /DNA_START=525 /DNA_END=3819 /DNA_ORIENTATION=+